jgi:cytochrome c oxidase cbb3-type subunit IV
MDINLIRGLVTLVSLAAFVGIVWWAYAPSRKTRWEQTGRDILDDDGRS